jgi:hypothetical protein
MPEEYSQWANTRPLRQMIKSAILELNMEIPWRQEWEGKSDSEGTKVDPLFGSNIREAARIIREWWSEPHGTDR